MLHYTFRHENYHLAGELLHDALGGVQGFLGIPESPADKKETVKAHVENTGRRAHDLVIRTSQQLESKPRERLIKIHDFKNNAARGIAVHDGGEIIVEPMTAIGETDAETQKALTQYNPAKVEADICAHFYHLALTLSYEGRASEFHDHVADARQRCVPSSHATGTMTTDDILDFYQQTTRLIAETTKNPPKSKYWGCAMFQQLGESMMQDYYTIEHEQNFAGAFGKVLEKMDGSAYVLQTVSSQPADQRVPIAANGANLMFGRYEGRLHRLFTLASDDPFYQQLAHNTAIECITTSMNYASYIQDPIPVTPDIVLPPSDVVVFYKDTLDRLTQRDAPLAKAEDFIPGKTLLYQHVSRLTAA